MNLNKGFLIDLDSLLDTRYGLISNLGGEIYDLNFHTEEGIKRYYSRLNDDFINLPLHVFNSLYRDRNKEILKKSKLTLAMQLLVGELTILTNKLIEANLPVLIKLDVLTHPYKLDKTEKTLIKNAIRRYTKNIELEVTFIDTNLKDLTLTSVGANYQYVIMYSGIEWLEYHTAIDSGDAINTKLITPIKLDYSRLPRTGLTPNDMENLIKIVNNVFYGYIDIKLLTIDYFSIIKKLIK